MDATDRLQNKIGVGSIVYVPIQITQMGGTPQQPTITGTTIYLGFNGANDTIGPVDSIQTVLSK